MSDLERRLRAAMLAAAEQAPPGLMAGIRRRHRQHVRRLGAACVAVAAAVAVGAQPVAHALRSGGPAGQSAVVTAPARPVPAAAPGTGLRTCSSSDGGSLSSNWQAASVHAGAAWFIFARLKDGWSASRRLSGGRLSVVPALIAVRQGATVELTGAPPAGGHVTFLPYFDKVRLPLRRNTAAGVTFIGCPLVPISPGGTIPAQYAPGLTMFWFGYITDERNCLPLEVRTPGVTRRIRVTLSLDGGICVL